MSVAQSCQERHTGRDDEPEHVVSALDASARIDEGVVDDAKSDQRCGETEEPLLALQHVGARALEHPALPGRRTTRGGGDIVIGSSSE